MLKDHHIKPLTKISRRKLLKIGLAVAASAIIPYESIAAVNDILYDDRSLCIYNLHTKEYLDVVYWSDGQYIPGALEEINHIFRDHYNGTVKSIDKDLLDFLFAIQKKMGCSEPYHLISGYRSRETNARLRKKSKKVAKKSLHISGKAADIRIPGSKIKVLRHAAYELKYGGVGYYPHSNFVHVDVGAVRFWRS